MQIAKLFIGIIGFQFLLLNANAAVKDSAALHIFPFIQPSANVDTSSSPHFIDGFLQLPDSLNPKRVYQYYSLDTMHLTKIDLTKTEFSNSTKTITEIPQLRPTLPEKWLFYFILFLACIVVFVKSFFTRYFNELWRSFFNLNNAMLMMRQQDIAFSVPGLLLSINFYIATAIYLFLKVHQLKWQLPVSDISLISILVLLIMCFIMFRFFVYRASMVMFSKRNELESISFIDLMQLEFVGVILVPIILILAFGSPVLTQYIWLASYLLISVALVYRLILGWRIGGRLIFQNWFHFILYICSVEIAPILIIIKSVQYAIVLS
ncbi:MAG: hypothetical protein RJA07_355 [Bacteroidota bacterium]|jgi:hypothetical protein